MRKRLLARLVRRALPSHFDDLEQEQTAMEAAENGIRHAARLIGIPVLIIGVGITAAIGGFLLLSPSRSGPPDLFRASRELGTENAQLRLANRDLQKERNALMELVAELEAQATQEPTHRGPARQDLQAPQKAPRSAPDHRETPFASVKEPPRMALSETPLVQDPALPQRTAMTVVCDNGLVVSAYANCSRPSPASPPLTAELQAAIQGAPPASPVRIRATVPREVGVPSSSSRSMQPQTTALVQQQAALDPPYAR